MSRPTERALVQGTVKFVVSCNDLMGMVHPNVAENDESLDAWLVNNAFKLINLLDAEVEVDNIQPVTISRETAEEHTDEMITDTEWADIIKESKGQ